VLHLAFRVVPFDDAADAADVDDVDDFDALQSLQPRVNLAKKFLCVKHILNVVFCILATTMESPTSCSSLSERVNGTIQSRSFPR
jgi:hypothetical protein